MYRKRRQAEQRLKEMSNKILDPLLEEPIAQLQLRQTNYVRE